MSAQLGGTGELYHEPDGRSSFNSSNTYCAETGMSDEEMAALLKRLSKGKWNHRDLTPRQQLFRDLAYCRMKLCRVRAKRSSYSERWVAFYRDECERLRRCLDAPARSKGKVVFPEIRAEVRSWLKEEAEAMPW